MVLSVLTGLIFPLVLGALSFALFARQASGSLLVRDGQIVGSGLIGQRFTGPEYFHCRPSVAGDDGYDARASGGSNLGPASRKLHDAVRDRAEDYRRVNGLPRDAEVPADAVMASASGLDPHISPANAELQVPRVARERGLYEHQVRRLVAKHTHGPQLGFLGEPYVVVLSLNLALDQLAARSSPRPK